MEILSSDNTFNEKVISYAQKNMNILEKVSLFKIISYKDLKEVLSDNKRSYEAFRQNIYKLKEKEILADTQLGYNLTKYLFINPKFIRKTSFFESANLKSDLLAHDALLTRAIIYLKKQNLIKKFLFENDLNDFKHNSAVIQQILNEDINPDALLNSKNNKLIAVEMEIFSKDRKRIFPKFKKYLLNNEIDHVLYIFNDKSVYKSYQLRLEEFKESFFEIDIDVKSIDQKFEFCLMPNLEYGSYDFNKTTFNTRPISRFNSGIF